jgi:hypothetical protein
MRLFELFEAKPAKVPATQPRNFVAKNAQTTGSGKHKADKKGGKPSKGNPQPRGEKHKSKLDEEE